MTPLGQPVNRLYFVGVLMSKVNNGTEDSPLYRTEVRDPTGTYYLYVGQYQPQPLSLLPTLEPPTLLGVVGKVRTFTKDDGSFYVSVKPEVLFPVDIPQRDRWILSASRSALERIKALEGAQAMEEPDIGALIERGHPRRAAEAALNAIGLYGKQDLTQFREAVKGALGLVLEGGGRPLMEVPPPPKEAAPKSPDIKEDVLTLIKECSSEKGALYRDIITRCDQKGIDRVRLEETIQELLDDGTIYEPTIGLIKVI
jgi:RPA family protein